jgi:hypothetical protein
VTRSTLILAAALVLLVIAGMLIGPAACNRILSQKKQIEVSQGQEGAAVDAGAEAMNTVSNVQQSSAATDQTVKEGTDAIRNAPEGKRGDAAVAANCRLRLYRDSERCAALRKAGAADAAGPHAGR